ncbi:MAG: EAL domain-containing protein [Synergistaceae bacterium]|nr:EAL domain-containing protein [Synergistaceae bacterium]
MRKEKRLLILLFCVILFSNVVLTPADSASEVLTVGVPANRCPIFYKDSDTDEIAGIGVDLILSAAKEAGYSVKFKAIEEKTLKDALDNAAYDVIMPFGSPITSSSGRRSIVSENLIQTPFTLVTEGRREMPPLQEIRVGMLRSLGGAAETVRQLFPGIKLNLFETMADSVKALRAGEVDALLHNSYVWSYVLQKLSYSDLAVQPSAMFSMDFRAGTLDTPKGRAIIERLNGGISKLTDTHRQAIILDYTTRRLYRYDFSDYLYQYGLILLLSLSLFVSLIFIAVMKMRTIRQEQEEKMRQLIDYDLLTGTLSMNGFRKRVEKLLKAHPNTPYFLSYNNIRDFKYINESLGRTSGNEILKFWANKISETLTDEEAVGRIEADHFAVLRRIDGDEKLLNNDKRILEPLQNFFIDQGKENRIHVSSGIYVLTPENYQKIDVDFMLDLARVAEKNARSDHKINYAIYNPEQWEKEKRIANVVNYLPKALKSGDIQVWYQPQVDYKTGKITGAEALCRWDHTKLGWLQPAIFISTLEETGLIFDLDSYVWNSVCRDLQRWNELGLHQSISVNVSRCDIREDRDIPAYFNKLVKTYGLSPDQLRIEITETAYAENPDILISTTEKLRKLGFQVEMDDFGSGYSSLHMLKEVPVDRIKLDLHFLTNSGSSEKGRIIVSYMIQMVRSLGMKLISEGVETDEQVRFLQSQGSSEMQGFYFYKPMPAKDFENLKEKIYSCNN